MLISVLLLLFFNVTLGVDGGLTGGYWFYDSTTKRITYADYAWKTQLQITPSQTPVIALQPVREQGHMTPTEIVRVSFDGQFNQTLIRASYLGAQFAVDPKNNALWYQDSGFTFRCAQNGRACQRVNVTTSTGLALDPSGSGVAYIAQRGSSALILYALYPQPSGEIRPSILYDDIGCCYGPFLSVFLASGPEGNLWSTFTRSYDDISFYFRDNAVKYGSPVEVSAPFFLAPKNPSRLFFSGGRASIYVLERGSIVKVTGREAEFLEASACPLDCSLNGNCVDGVCACFAAYYGRNCSVWCEAAQTCSGHGRCGVEGECVCDPFWMGKRCESPLLYPPMFPVALTVKKVQGPAGVFNYFYDFPGQRNKVQDANGNNVTNLYNLGITYSINAEGICTSSFLPTTGLDRWGVNTNATLVGVNMTCAEDEKCSYWQYASGGHMDEWKVTMDSNVPVEVVISSQRFLYDPKEFTIGEPDGAVWVVPSNCNPPTHSLRGKTLN